MRNSAQSIQLSASIQRRLSRAAKKANRNPSEFAAEALEWYLRVCSLSDVTPTPAELRSIRRGREAFKKGDYVSLDEFRSEEAMVRRSRRGRAKIS
jgi:predicted transcriptional regulator